MLEKSFNSSSVYDDSVAAQVPRDRDHADHEYSHILVPTGLSPREVPAIRLGLKMAAANKAKLSLLHVVPKNDAESLEAERGSSMHWLDAIDRLHEAVFNMRKQVASDAMQLMREAQQRLAEFFDREVPRRLRGQTQVQLQCAIGDVAEEIARFATVESADLMIITSGLSRWKLPVVPGRVHRVLQQVRGQIIVVRPDVQAEKAKPLSLRAAT